MVVTNMKELCEYVKNKHKTRNAQHRELIKIFGKQTGEQEILNRWENRWFESDWYDTRSIEDFLYDTDYSIELGE
jgi:hypothetical protein